MSRTKQIYDIPSTGSEVLILKRLLEVALYDYVDNHIEVNITNTKNIKNLLELTLIDFNVDNLMNWILNVENKPTRFELMLLYNQMKVNTIYLRKKCKVLNSNIYSWKKEATIKQYTLDNDTLINILAGLIKINWTIFNYSMFKKIEWGK